MQRAKKIEKNPEKHNDRWSFRETEKHKLRKKRSIKKL